MNDYFVFGGRLRSELEFPDLSPATPRDAPDWELQVSGTEVPQVPSDFQGMYEVGLGWVFRLYRLANGFRLEYGTTGSYDILSAGRQIVWYPGSDAPLEMVRAIILGPVMALALHESGILCLHGSAVAIEGKGVAFLAHKHFGKSTLAIALTAAGGRLITDDLVAVNPSPFPTVRPGVHSVRMRSDVAERLSPEFPGTTVHDGWKKTLTNLPKHQLAWESAPLSAIYLLEPVKQIPGGHAVLRTRLPLIQATASLAHRTKLADELVGYGSAGAMLQWIAMIVSAVPVYRLEVLRDLERLPEVVRQFMVWYRVPAPFPSQAAARA